MLDPKEEARFEELRDVCRELKVPSPPQIMIGLQVHDKDGNLTFDDVQRGHSWTRNFWNRIFIHATGGVTNGASFGAGYMTQKNSSGSVQSIGYLPWWSVTEFMGAGDAGSSTNGISVGTGDTAFNVDQYILVTPVAHGNSASQLAYSAMSAATSAYTAGTKTWKTTLVRVLNNNSGGSITIKETGIYFYVAAGFLLERSVLSPTVAVANGAQLTVTYEISMDFSSID